MKTVFKVLYFLAIIFSLHILIQYYLKVKSIEERFMDEIEEHFENEENNDTPVPPPSQPVQKPQEAVVDNRQPNQPSQQQAPQNQTDSSIISTKIMGPLGEYYDNSNDRYENELMKNEWDNRLNVYATTMEDAWKSIEVKPILGQEKNREIFPLTNLNSFESRVIAQTPPEFKIRDVKSVSQFSNTYNTIEQTKNSNKLLFDYANMDFLNDPHPATIVDNERDKTRVEEIRPSKVVTSMLSDEETKKFVAKNDMVYSYQMFYGNPYEGFVDVFDKKESYTPINDMYETRDQLEVRMRPKPIERNSSIENVPFQSELTNIQNIIQSGVQNDIIPYVPSDNFVLSAF